MSGVVPFDEIATCDLRRGWIYEAGAAGNVGDEPIHHILRVGNQGGIRFAGPSEQPRLVVLFSTLAHDDWPDTIDQARGLVRYHGDNRLAAGRIDEPKGNQMLRNIFGRGFATEKARHACPPFFVFSVAGEPGLPKRSQRFEGLAVPGGPGIPAEDWLLGKWYERSSGRFENYLLTLTLLDIQVIARSWIEELHAGESSGPSAPEAFRSWLLLGHRGSGGED